MKFKKVLPVLLGSLCAATLFAGCQVGGSKSGEILLAGFETYEELHSYHYTNYFGAAKPSKEYVTQGDGGVALTVNGRFSNTQRPAIVIDTNTEYLEKSDYTDVSQIKIDMRNDNDYAANVYFQYGSLTETGLKLSSAMKKTLDAGFEGTVTFDIDRNLVSEFLNLDYVTELRLVFDSPKEALPSLGSVDEALENYRKFHVDNLRAVLTDKAIVKSPVRKAREIESGDKEEYLAAWYLPSGYIWSPSSVSFNDKPEYIKGGKGSLKFKLEGSTRDPGGYSTAYWAMSVNQNPDISDKYGVGFWVYNAEETDPINLYSHAPLSNTEKFVQKLEYGWNYIELTVNELRDKYGYDEKNFLFGMVVQFMSGKDYDIYLDEMYMIEYTMPEIQLPKGENVGNLYYAAYGADETVTLPQATVKHAASHSVAVLDPNGDEVAVVGNSFTPSVTGEYIVTYTATAASKNADGEFETVEKSIVIAVGNVPTFNNASRLTDVFGRVHGELYTIPETALSSAQVTWRVELYGGRFNGIGKAGMPYDYTYAPHGYVNGVLDNNPTSFHLIRGIDHRIVYTARGEDGVRAQYIQHVYADEKEYLLSDRYENFYDSTRVGGNLTVNENADGFILKSSGTKATGVYNNSLQVGYQAKFLRFMVYNASEQAVTFKVNNGMEFTIAANGYALFNPDSFGYQAAVVGWNMASANSKLLPLTFVSTASSDGIELYISRFAVNEDAFEAPTLQAPIYDEFYEENTYVTIGKASVVGLGSYNYKVTAPDGSVVLDDVSTANANMKILLTQTGVYKVEYSTSYEDYNGNVQDLYAMKTFKVLAENPEFLTEVNQIVDMQNLADGSYTLTDLDKPDLALVDGSTAVVTAWKVYKFHRDYVNRVTENYSLADEMYEMEAPENELIVENGALVGLKPQKYYSYRIEYKINAYDESFTVNKTLFFTSSDKMMNITEAYGDFYTAGQVGGNAISSATTGISLIGNGGVNTISGEFSNPVSLGKLTNMTLVFYNAGDEDVYLFFFGSPDTGAVRTPMKAKQYNCLNFNVTTLKSWGFVTETEEGFVFGGLSGAANKISLKVYAPKNALNVSLCGIWLNADAFLPVLDGVTYEDEYSTSEDIVIAKPTTLVNITDYTVSIVKEGETEAVYTCTKAEVEAQTATFKATTSGNYTVTYKATYVLNGVTKTYEKTYSFFCKMDVNDPTGEGIITDKWLDIDEMY